MAKDQVVDVLPLAGQHFSKRPFDPFHSFLNLACEFLSLWDGRGERDNLKRVADVVIHEPNHFQLSCQVLVLPPLVEEHHNASADSD